MNQGFIQSPTRQGQQGWQHRDHSGASRRGLTLDLPRSIWPSRVTIDLLCVKKLEIYRLIAV